jgi:dolichyl-phosphate-mannose--protein O-mannosyl transferase
MVTGLTFVAGLVRYVGIAWPHGFVFDEFYAADACLYVFGPHGACQTTAEVGVEHPPLGMWLIGMGERVLGMTPTGWRAASLVAGTVGVCVLYVIARRLLGSTLAASLAAGLLAFDFLHFVMSRTAMLDIFVVCFGLIAFWCLLHDRDAPATAPGPAALRRRLRERPWLLATGMAGGAALATKWSGGYLLAGLLALAILFGAARRSPGPQPYRRALREEGALWLVALVLIPAAIYMTAYAGRLNGTLLAWPWAPDSWVRAFLTRQHEMLAHHTGALYVHPYASPAWSWPLIRRPVLFTINALPDGGYQEILALGNPFAWWPALAALAVVMWRALRRRDARSPDTLIAIGFLAGYLPWLILSRREAFIYYLLPAVPFLYLALAHVIAAVSRRATRVTVTGVLTAAVVASFVFFRPILIGRTLSHPQWERRLLFRDCGPMAPGDTLRPFTEAVPSPRGWCWA